MLEELIAVGLISLTNAPSSQIPGARLETDNGVDRHAVSYAKTVARVRPAFRQQSNAALLLLDDVIRYTKNDSYRIKRTLPLADFDGNYYVLVEFDPFGYGIYCLGSGDFSELAPFAESPYAAFDEKDCLRYVPNRGYFAKDETNRYFTELKTNSIIEPSVEEGLSLSSKLVYQSMSSNPNIEKVSFVADNLIDFSLPPKGSPAPNIDRVDPHQTILMADREVPYAWYFKYNVDRFPENVNDFCGYTSLSMVLAYHEIFSSAGYFSKEESSKYIEPSWGGYGISVPKLADEFPTDIWGDDIGGSIPSDMEKATTQFMEGKDIEYSDGDWYWVFSDVRNEIDNGAPVIYFGEWRLFDTEDYYHAPLVYGYYEEGKLLCHWGWDGYSQVLADKRAFYNEGGYYVLINKEPHKHKTYFKSYTGVFKCGCGMVMDC